MALTRRTRLVAARRSRSATSFALLLVPLAMIFYRTFEDGLGGVLGAGDDAGRHLGDQRCR